MNWFTQICRNVGLMFHNVKHPDDHQTQKREIKRTIEETKQGSVTLRRTTIEEIEYKHDDQ